MRSAGHAADRVPEATVTTPRRGSCPNGRPAQSRPMNALMTEYGLATWKAVLTAALLPPVPFLLLALWGAGLLWGRRTFGWLPMLLAVAGLYLGACAGIGQALTPLLLPSAAGLRPDAAGGAGPARPANGATWPSSCSAAAARSSRQSTV